VSVVVPDFILPTSEARRVLPSVYSKADAIFNVQRSALLIAALSTGARDAFPTALEDRLHQPYRERLVPGLGAILKLRVPGLLGCALSGAGPSVLVFYERSSEAVCELVREKFAEEGHDSEILPARIDQSGYTLTAELKTAKS
jgi:homoserine kinase